MKKRLFSMAAAVMLAAVTVTGCGGSGNGSGAGSDTFNIGGIGPTTGAAAIYGSCVMNAAQIAVDEINESGGVNGYKLAYRFEDDVNDAEKSVNAYNSLKDWGMQILMGTVTTTPCIAVATETAADGMFQITPSASSTDVIDDNDNVYQVCFTDPNQGSASADYIANNKQLKGISKVAVIYDSSSVYSTGIHDTFVRQAKKDGLEVVSDTAFTADTNTDFSTQLQKAQESGAELVFLPIYYQEASIILQQAKSMNYEPTFFGVDGMDGILTLEGFDTSLAEGVMLLTPFSADADDDTTKNFVSKYKGAYGDVPNQFGADAYDAVYIIKQALEESNATPDMSADEIGAVMKDAMKDLTFEGGITGDSMAWDDNGAVNKAPKAVIIQKGAYKSMD